MQGEHRIHSLAIHTRSYAQDDPSAVSSSPHNLQENIAAQTRSRLRAELAKPGQTEYHALTHGVQTTACSLRSGFSHSPEVRRTRACLCHSVSSQLPADAYPIYPRYLTASLTTGPLAEPITSLASLPCTSHHDCHSIRTTLGSRIAIQSLQRRQCAHHELARSYCPSPWLFPYGVGDQKGVYSEARGCGSG